MYNLWIITIILAVAGIAGIVALWISFKREYEESSFVFDYDYDDAYATNWVLSGFILAIIMVFVFVSIFGPINARNYVNELIIEGEALQSLVDGREGLDKPYIMDRVVVYNKQVSKILAKVKTHGRWSRYYFTHYELLKCIEL